MPNWNEVLIELQKEAGLSPQDRVRRRFLADLSTYTKRNVIVYYSGWLQKPSHTSTLSHNRQIPISDLQGYGLKVVNLEDDSDLQDLVLTVHHAYMHTFSTTPAIKIIENHNGKAMVIFMGQK